MSKEDALSVTERKLQDALNRMVSGNLTNRELKRKLKANKLKINFTNVEMEAGLSNGSSKYYLDIRKKIESAERVRINGESNISDSEVRAHPLFKDLEDKLSKRNDEVKRLKSKLKMHNEKLASYKKLLKAQSVTMHHMNVAMWEQIPEEQKHVEVMIDVQELNEHSNVLEFRKREDLG